MEKALLRRPRANRHSARSADQQVAIVRPILGPESWPSVGSPDGSPGPGPVASLAFPPESGSCAKPPGQERWTVPMLIAVSIMLVESPAPAPLHHDTACAHEISAVLAPLGHKHLSLKYEPTTVTAVARAAAHPPCLPKPTRKRP